MKELRLLSLVCTALLIVVGLHPFSASDQLTQTPVQNSAEKWPIVLTQKALSKQKGTERAKAALKKFMAGIDVNNEKADGVVRVARH
jgi:hypothetical protein